MDQVSVNGLPADFEWIADYDVVLDEIASTDILQTEWPKLRDVIKCKIEKNISVYLAESDQVQKATPLPRPHSPQSLPSGGLKIAPFPPRQRVEAGLNEAPKTFMTPDEANEFKEAIFAQLHEFDQSSPFTLQRLCELCIRPQQNYKSVGKYLRAVEKTLLVTSTWDAFPPLAEKDQTGPLQTTISIGATAPSAPATPVFSPIPFLHDDARRSKSRSPPPSPLALPAADAGVGLMGVDSPKALGLVDELDDPSPGHMSDHPTALTSTTTTTGSRPFLGSLEERFVRSGGPEATEGAQQADGDNGMVLDEADDKENKG